MEENQGMQQGTGTTGSEGNQFGQSSSHKDPSRSDRDADTNRDDMKRDNHRNR